MPWTIEWSLTQEAKAHKAAGTPRLFEAQTRDDALRFAEQQINDGRIVWCLKDEHGVVVMDREAVFSLVHSAQRPSKVNPPKPQAREPQAVPPQTLAAAPAKRNPSAFRKMTRPFRKVVRFLKKRR